MPSLFSAATLLRKRAPSDQEPTGLLPVLTAWDLTLLGIGCIIGTGIFVLTGIAAADQAGPAVVLSFVVSGFACAFAALAYAELSSSVGGCGSAYGYSYAAFGELMAWIIGWDLVLEYGVSVAAVANGWSGYFNTGLAGLGSILKERFNIDVNLDLPYALTHGPFAQDPATHELVPGIVNLPAACIILVLMGILIVGIKQSARLNTVMVIVKLSTIAVFLAVAVGHVNTALWSPFMPYGWFSTLPDGKTVGVLAGASVVFFAYVGFDAVSTAVEEARNPARDVPIGILSSLAFCTVIYIVVSGVLTGIVPYKDLDVKEGSPVAYALQQIGFNGASILVSTGVIFGLTTVMLVLYYGLTRIIFAMSRDGLLPPSLGAVNAKTHTPVRTTVICGVIMSIMAGCIPLGTLAELVNIGTLVAFVLVCGGVIVLRLRHPEMKRPFQAPFGLVIPILGILSCGALVAFLPFLTHLRFIAWLAVGLLIYFGYSARHSRAGGAVGN